jgi:protein SCO1/2
VKLRAGPRVAALSLAVVAGALTGPAGASERELSSPAFDAGTALAASQAAIGQELPDLELTDENGARFRLSGFRGRPLVISPIYTSCYHVCPTTTAYLKMVVNVADEMLGESAFTVLTVGFDTENDTPERMRSYGRERGIDSPQWIFASADPATAQQLMDRIGFVYARTAGGFDHMVQATVVDAEGRVYQQVYGQQFDAPMLVEALKQAVMGQLSRQANLPALIDRVRLICTVFDPNSGRYHFDYSIVVAFVVGVLCLGAIATFIWRSWRELPPGGRTT